MRHLRQVGSVVVEGAAWYFLRSYPQRAYLNDAKNKYFTKKKIAEQKYLEHNNSNNKRGMHCGGQSQLIPSCFYYHLYDGARAAKEGMQAVAACCARNA
jgi:hypothetical protein